MRAEGTKLPRKQEAAIAALLSERTNADAAKTAGISEATLQRWLLLPEFQRAYRAARLAVVEAAVGRLQRATAEAVEALRRNLSAGRPGDQIRAAVAILDHAYRGVELLDIEERVSALEGGGTGGGCHAHP